MDDDDDDDDDVGVHVYSAMAVRIPTGVQHPGAKQTRDAYQLQLFTPQFCFHSIKRGPWGVGGNIKPAEGKKHGKTLQGCVPYRYVIENLTPPAEVHQFHHSFNKPVQYPFKLESSTS